MGDSETQSLFEQVGKYLQELDLNFDAQDEGYIGVYEGVHMTWRIVIRTDSESELHSIRVSSILPIKAPTHIRGVGRSRYRGEMPPTNLIQSHNPPRPRKGFFAL